MKPNIYRFADVVDGTDVYEKIKDAIINNRMIPVLGSGFSYGFKANNGTVPSVNDLKEKIKQELTEDEEYDEYDAEELERFDLSRLSDMFMQLLEEHSDGDKVFAPKSFLKYMEDHFYNVHDCPNYIKSFLRCDWEYLYTLNYDDTIEKTLPEYEVVVPYRNLNQKWLKEKKCVIKLHGDVHTMLSCKEMKYCTLSKSQYLNSITSSENKDLMEWLQDDCSSKDLLFIGCSLSGEYDFLFAEGTKRVSQLSYDASENSFYIYYDCDPEGKIPLYVRSDLDNYGIKNIIRVTPDEMPEFYSLICEFFKEKASIQKEDKLEKYRNFVFEQLTSCDLACNLPYIFENKSLLANPRNNTILFPYFYTHRTVSKNIINALERGIPVCIIAGNRFAGKTYALLEIVDELQKKHKKVYYIGDKNISTQILNYIISCYHQAVFVFDCRTIENRQFQNIILNNLNAMVENSIQIVYAVNRSDRNFTKVIHIDESMRGFVEYYSIDSILDSNELTEFNSKIKKLTIVNRKKNDTFLDYAFRIENSRLSDCKSILPDVNLIGDKDMLRCILLLANCNFMSVTMANRFDITEELVGLCEKSNGAVQKDYLSDFELTNLTHSGVKYVSNSLYWLYRCLANYAKDSTNYETIADVIVEIVKTYIEIYQRGDVVDYQVYQEIKPYYYLDTLQQIFFFDSPSRGSIALPDIIYSKLRSVLHSQYQFLHQTSKCKLRYSQQLGLGSDKGIRVLEEANLIIDRAMELADQSASRNKQYTITHMNVTKALILTNYLRYSKNDNPEKKEKQLLTAIDCYYCFYVEFKEYSADLTDAELSDVKWFMEQLFTGDDAFRGFVTDKEHRKKVEELLNAYYKKRITISWT